MVALEQQTGREEPEIRLLQEWLPRISGECRAYIKGATQALLFAQEEAGAFAVPEAGRCFERISTKNSL